MPRGSRAQVMHGTVTETSGGLHSSDLKYDKNGKIVSKVKSNLAKKNLGPWVAAVKKAKSELDIHKGDDFKHHVLKKSGKLYKLAKSIYKGKARKSKSKSKSRKSKSARKSKKSRKSKSKSARKSKSKKSRKSKSKKSRKVKKSRKSRK